MCSAGMTRIALLVCVVGCGRAGAAITGELAPASSPSAFVQNTQALPQSAQSSVAVADTAAQTAGDLNVVIVGWNDTTASVSTVTDSKGNAYQLAIGPTQRPGALSQSIYYARNIVAAAANANTVTVAFNQPANYVDLRVLRYTGTATI